MNLDGISFNVLQSVPVQLRGAWSENKHADWRGIATSSTPLVGIAFIDVDGDIEWCKSERDSSTLELRLALFPHDVTGMDVQVNFTVFDGGRRSRTTIPSPSYRPELPDVRELQTGTIYRFATVSGTPRVSTYFILVVRDDAESSRSTLWRVRRRLESHIEEPFRQWFTHGRTGRYRT